MHTPRPHRLHLPGHRHGDKPQPHTGAHGDGSRAHGRSAGMALLLLLALAQLMVILDISAVNVALPDLANDLRIGGGDLGWTITSYSLVFGSLLLLGGRAADVFGRRRVFLAGLGVFTMSSLVSALAGSAVDHHHDLPGPGPREGARGLGRRGGRRRRDRRAAGRIAHRARRLAR